MTQIQPKNKTKILRGGELVIYTISVKHFDHKINSGLNFISLILFIIILIIHLDIQFHYASKCTHLAYFVFDKRNAPKTHFNFVWNVFI